MIITTNGKQKTVCDGASLESLLLELGLAPERVVVEHNGKALQRQYFASTVLRSGDTLEIAQMVGGG